MEAEEFHSPTQPQRRDWGARVELSTEFGPVIYPQLTIRDCHTELAFHRVPKGQRYHTARGKGERAPRANPTPRGVET
jgi:hypothetical protein